ncbi:GmrSD restriction endonuclease domain-containing protein [Pseudomonas azotoformans]|uniref:DUF262 domain-containing protein n=1 Tax=Pseudomonas sp. P7759 TaxID=2738831 RepID=UPI0015A456C9|nr:DUF262 domain-containing protein [Pseudomonas sp. P7759]NWC77843.1 DUF262 domain-containing protein [Pseudomonas sp. P7759]
MAYKSSTIAGVIRRLNRDYYLPAIQRPYVWTPEQIVRLFDSLLKGYPISSFLFWDIDPSQAEKLDIYKFVEDFKFGDFHNEEAKINDQHLTLVLDGQQRLTSLLIGLRGSYKVKLKGKRWQNPDSWVRQNLYLDLMKDASDEEAESDVSFGLSFFTSSPTDQENAHWFPVSSIMQFADKDQFDAYLEKILETLEEKDVSRVDRKIIERNLKKLYHAIWVDESIAFFTETSRSLERVLDIFVRANEGGTKLSKSDLLLSTITTTWGDLNAREEIYGFVDYLNTGLARNNNFDKDWVMKACLVLSDLPNAYKVSNFTKKNLDLIRENWERIKTALEMTVRLTNDFGIDRETLTSANALLPIAYYFFQTSMRFNSTESRHVGAVRAMHRWLVKALLASTFGGSSDGTISQSRKIIQESMATSNDFPEQALLIGLRRQSQIDFTDPRSLDDLLSLTYQDWTCFFAISLLHPDTRWGTAQYHVDHIFPQGSLTKAKLLSQGIPESEMDAYVHGKDRLSNLQLLPYLDNIEKSDTAFEVWLADRSPAFIDQHSIPAEPELYKIDRFRDFLDARDVLLRKRYAEILGFDEALLAETTIASEEENQVIESKK